MLHTPDILRDILRQSLPRRHTSAAQRVMPSAIRPLAPIICIASLVLSLWGTLAAARGQWTEQQASAWYRMQPWPVGANYIPANAINQLEMWQAESFDPNRIDLELGWAQSLGMNTMRIFLHDLLWQQDPQGFTRRIDRVLDIARHHHIRVLLVLFDSCWDPDPHLGKQRAPVPGVHNSGWVQSPSAKALEDNSQYGRLETYVKGIVAAFANDDRVIGWDLWNEPPNSDDGGGNYAAHEAPHKAVLVRALLPQVFSWARASEPSQPLTSGLFDGDWSSRALRDTERIQIEESDILSFHSYDRPELFGRKIRALGHYNRPIICTEYMARTVGSTFFNTLPIAMKERVGAINWGLVAGKTQTYYPWDSWQRPYEGEPALWFHDVLRTDGTAYDPKETALIRQMTRSGSL